MAKLVRRIFVVAMLAALHGRVLCSEEYLVGIGGSRGSTARDSSEGGRSFDPQVD